MAELTRLASAGAPPPDELLRHGATALARLTGDSCMVMLLSGDRRWVHPVAVADPSPEITAALESFVGLRLRAMRGFSVRVFETCRAVRLPTTSSEVLKAGRPELAAFARSFDVHSLLLAPMRVRGEAIGIVVLMRAREAPPYGIEDEGLLQAVSDLLALSVASGPHGVAALVPDAPPGDAERGELAAREREVLALLALGHTNREIADRLVLSVRTVEWHRARIQWKLGVSGRAALVAHARGLGLID